MVSRIAPPTTHRTALSLADASSPLHASSLLLAIDAFFFYLGRGLCALDDCCYYQFSRSLTRGTAASHRCYPVIHATCRRDAKLQKNTATEDKAARPELAASGTLVSLYRRRSRSLIPYVVCACDSVYGRSSISTLWIAGLI